MAYIMKMMVDVARFGVTRPGKDYVAHRAELQDRYLKRAAYASDSTISLRHAGASDHRWTHCYHANTGDPCTEAIENFQNQLLCNVETEQYDYFGGDPDIVTVIKDHLDFMWTNAWRPNLGISFTPGSFHYNNVTAPGGGGPNASVQLNQMYLVSHMFVYRETGDSTYLNRARTIAATLLATPNNGTDGPFLKTFAQWQSDNLSLKQVAQKNANEEMAKLAWALGMIPLSSALEGL